MKEKNKILLFILIIAVSIILVIGGTVAFFGWRAEEESTVDVTIASGTGECSLISDNNILLEPTTSKEKGRIIKLKASHEVGKKAYIEWNMVINQIGGLQHKTFKYEIINATTGLSYGSGTFENNTSNSTIKFKNDTDILDFGDENEFILYLWIDGTSENNPLSMADQDFDFDLNCTITSTPALVLSEQITNLYLNNKDESPVTNNDVSYGYASIYDKDNDSNTSGGLMNDRQGNMSTGEDAGNVRYYGANPNNYIYFNCSNYSNQTSSTCELWRIIGVFDGKVKLMRNESIGNLAWDQNKNQNSTSTSYNSNWSSSSLQEFLNGKYYDRGDKTTLDYYSEKDGSVSTTLNLESIGIKDNTRNLISETLWYLRGWNDAAIYSDDVYDYERNSGELYSTSWSPTMQEKIGIPYASDYGYAADFNSCTVKLSKYNNTLCTGTNWMKPIIYGTTSQGWLINPLSGYSNDAWSVVSSGAVSAGNSNRNVYTPLSVVPVLYLNSELSINDGDGTQNTPYKLMLS